MPAGDSRWELGCDKDVASKANGDYNKRTSQMDADERQGCSFVFVTPRRWPSKGQWLAEKKARGEWADVRAYDADDLEQWLEHSPAIALQFASELGLSGWGVESLEHYWLTWSSQSNPPITTESLTRSREKIRDKLIATMDEALENTERGLLSIQADSTEEAVAFVASNILAQPRLLSKSIVVTQPEGWRFVAANPEVRIAIAAGKEIGAAAIVRDNLLVIVPHAIGDQADSSNGGGLLLDRPDIYEFEKALVAIGMEESDARRNALVTGRSWTVLRRQLAINPTLNHPAWLDCPQASSLVTLCLLGAWNTENEVDQQIVERLANKTYEAIESDLRHLAALDDPPVLRIGSVWRAKSPLELLILYGKHITSSQLDRFFEIAEELLTPPDPQLELPEQERYAAQIHGKVRPHSGLLLNSLCDALIKLAARGADLRSLRDLHIEVRVENLVRKLLLGADEIRWLSLSSHLPALAEAAPEAFLTAIQDSLNQMDPAVFRLLSESSTGLFGRCWHAGLLWALESLAWSHRRMLRVTLILAQLCEVRTGGNWANKPSSTLLGIFRSWLPQTAADISARIGALDLLIKRYPSAGFELLQALSSGGQDHASPAYRPKWRDEDAGVGNGVSNQEHYQMIQAAWQKAVEMSSSNPARLATLFQEACGRDHNRISHVAQLVEQQLKIGMTDEDRIILRDVLRNILYWHANFDRADTAILTPWLASMQSLYTRLSPSDLVAQHRWLFDNHWTQLPEKDDESPRVDKLTKTRVEALGEVYRAHSFDGINRLIDHCGSPYTVGGSLSELHLPTASLVSWIADGDRSFETSSSVSLSISGLLNRLPPESLEALLEELMSIASAQDWSPHRRAALFCLVATSRSIWNFIEALGGEVASIYWKHIHTGHSHLQDAADLNFTLESLLVAGRPLAALELCKYEPSRVEANLLLRILQELMNAPEPEGPLIDPWCLGDVFAALECSLADSKEVLIQIEFYLFEALGYGQEQRASSLLNSVMSDPALFAELIGFCYKPEHGHPEETDDIDETRRTLARPAYKVLHACRTLPGQLDGNSFDSVKFNQYVEAALRTCEQSGRGKASKYQLGEILARSCGFGSRDLPPTAVLELLEGQDMAALRRGFCFGTWNDRGTTSRDPRAGGMQERQLSSLYRSNAEQLQNQYPQVASMYESIAGHYDTDGEREDIEANLRKEGY